MAKLSYRDFLNLAEAAEEKCALTGLPITPETAEVDHIIPVQKGGKHVLENLQVVHKTLNRMKSNLTQQEFDNICVLRVAMIADKAGNKPLASKVRTLA